MTGLGRTNIELGTASFNPVPGCTNGCWFCWARTMAKRNLVKCEKCRSFEPHLHQERLEQPIHTRKPQRVLVNWTGDLVCKGVKKEWIEQVYDACKAAPWHKYLFLTKCPENIPKQEYPDNWWFGTSISNDDGSAEECRRFTVGIFMRLDLPRKFLMIEPLLYETIDYMPAIRVYPVDWIIVGAQTGKDAKMPSRKVVEWIINECKKAGIPLFLKDNLLARLPELPKIQEFPKELDI